MSRASYKRERNKNKEAQFEADNLFNLFTTRPLSRTRQDKTRQLYLTRLAQSAAKLVSLGALVNKRLIKAYLLRILALEASSWSQITFYTITNVLISYFERFGPNFWANIHLVMAGVLSSGGQAGCNADFLSRFLSHHDFSTNRHEGWLGGWIEKKTPLHERTHNLWLLLVLFLNLVFVSSTRDSVSSAIQNTKIFAACRISISTIFPVFGYADETLSRMFETKTKLRIKIKGDWVKSSKTSFTVMICFTLMSK